MKNYAISMGVFLIIGGCWRTALNAEYGHFTWITSVPYNHAYIGRSRIGDPMKENFSGWLNMNHHHLKKEGKFLSSAQWLERCTCTLRIFLFQSINILFYIRFLFNVLFHLFFVQFFVAKTCLGILQFGVFQKDVDSLLLLIQLFISGIYNLVRVRKNSLVQLVIL